MMKTRTKLDVKSQRPKRYIRRDAGKRKMLSAMLLHRADSWGSGSGSGSARVGTYRCGRRGRRAALSGGSSGASASRLASVAGLDFPLL